MNKFMEQAIAIKDDIVEYRRVIHSNPEVGAELPKTKAYVMDKLREFGYEPEEICESGIVATIEGSKPGKTFLLRADMDALPMAEATDCDFKATNGAMHSCGHDMHTAMLLGAAKLLKQNQDEIEGTVKLVFQPDEEGFTGAKKMIEAGVLQNPKVDAAMAMHVNSGTPSNLVVCGLGTSIGGCNRFRIVVKGTGCHGALPETGVDPINIAAHIFLAIQEITSREIPATKPAVITIGKFAGGDAPNIIPNEVTGYMKDIVGEQGIFLFEGGGMGSEDFASYSYEVPSLYVILGAGAKNENPLYGVPMHNEKVVFNEDVLPTGAAMHAYSAIMWLKNNK